MENNTEPDFNQQRINSVVAAFRRLKFVYIALGAFRVEVNLAGAFNRSQTQNSVNLFPKGKRRNSGGYIVINEPDMLERWKVAEGRLHYAQKNITTGAIKWVDAETERL